MTSIYVLDFFRSGVSFRGENGLFWAARSSYQRTSATHFREDPMSENVTAHGLKKKAFLAAFRETGNVRAACDAGPSTPPPKALILGTPKPRPPAPRSGGRWPRHWVSGPTVSVDVSVWPEVA